jgi:hypothetical protein
MAADALAQASEREVAARVLADTRDEVSMLLQTGVMLNCANVTTGEMAAPKLINHKRKAKGKPPFFSYRVLQVRAPCALDNSSGDGQHASARAHLRRAHTTVGGANHLGTPRDGQPWSGCGGGEGGERVCDCACKETALSFRCENQQQPPGDM